ncbi:arabinosyltransferase domain-containing protein [Amycolatopsis minnesotensis]|uniref:arabinosyltransferase domain-containing protein n=1 Tax=Amycolatopsis minnesotensis TaxID=337894 RepID=UPI0031DD56DB
MATKDQSPARRWGVAALGLISALASVLFVLVPVDQNVTTYEWPSQPGAQGTALPMYPYQPERFDARFDCAQPADALVLSTVPPGPGTGEAGSPPGLVVRTANGTVTVSLDGTPLASRPLAPSCQWTVHADETGTTVAVDGTPIGHSGKRPDVNSLFTGSPSAATHVTVVGDTRFDTGATGFKIALGALAAVCLLAALALTRHWDTRFARRARLLPRRWWRPRAADLVVTAVLAVWAVIGSLTVDDGYISTMLKARPDSGFTGNYFRWFNAPEAPFGWFYEVYHWLTLISPAQLFLRLPSVLLGLLAWGMLDRLLLPRFLSASRGSRRWARWACVALFLVWYLPYDVGLRPEPFIVVGSLAVFALVERALATSAVAPLATGIVVAGATVAVTPTGIAAFLPFVAGIGGIIRLLRRRRDQSWLGLLALLLATGASALLLMCYDQTLATVLDATRVRTAIGPDFDWQREIGRYATLLDPSVVEGALNRRVPMLLMLFSMAVLGALLINHRVPGLVESATRRLVVSSGLYLVALMFTPTKWTHHFGALAGFGALLTALLVHTVAKGALRSVWARSVSLALLAGVVALAVSAPNRWWYVSALNVRWVDEAPTARGYLVGNLVLVAGLAIAAAGGVIGTWRTSGGRPADQRALRWLPSSGWLIVAVAIVVVVAEVGTMAQAVTVRWHSYSIGRANLASLTGTGSCGIEDWLEVEPDVGASVLHPVAGSPPAALGGLLANAGFPASAAPQAPYGTDAEHPVWGSYRAPKTTGTASSAWYALPSALNDPARPPLVVTRAGTGRVTVLLEFARADGSPVSTVDIGGRTGGAWKDARVDTAEQAAGADRVRVVVKDDDPGDGWLASTAPRFPEVVPSTALVPTGEPVVLDWVNGFVLPCRKPVSLGGGMILPARYRFSPGPDSASLAGVSYATGAGGPYAPLLQLARERVVPTYLRGDKLREPVTVIRFDYLAPMNGVRVTHGVRSRSGLERGPALIDPMP